MYLFRLQCEEELECLLPLIHYLNGNTLYGKPLFYLNYNYHFCLDIFFLIFHIIQDVYDHSFFYCYKVLLFRLDELPSTLSRQKSLYTNDLESSSGQGCTTIQVNRFRAIFWSVYYYSFKYRGSRVIQRSRLYYYSGKQIQSHLVVKVVLLFCRCSP